MPGIDIRKLAAELHGRRRDRGLRAVADEIGGVSAATLSRVEKGKVPDLDTFLRICAWLGKSPQDFMAGDTPPPSGDAQPDTPSVITAHLKADRTLTPETAEALSTVIRLAYEAAKAGSIERRRGE